jgi:hypothetical protein
MGASTSVESKPKSSKKTLTKRVSNSVKSVGSTFKKSMNSVMSAVGLKKKSLKKKTLKKKTVSKKKTVVKKKKTVLKKKPLKKTMKKKSIKKTSKK